MGLARDTVGLIELEARAVLDEAKKKTYRKWRALSESKQRLEAMVSLARGDVTACHTDLNKCKYLLNCKNGTIDLKTGKLRSHCREELHTKSTGIYFSTKAKAPKWNKFLQQVLPDEDARAFLQRFVGYSATGDVTERTFTILYGLGRNGKSVFLKMVSLALGEYAGTAAPELLMAKKTSSHPTDVADLYSKRLVIASEVKKGRGFDEESVKRLTGNDTLSARRMNEDFWQYEPTHKLLLAINHKPSVRDASDSFWDRVALIPFNVRIQDQDVDRNLVDELTEELPGILAWIVEGAKLWNRHGLKRPKGVAAATAEYRADEDRVGQFVLECVKLDSSSFTTNEALATNIRAWCDERGLYPLQERDVAERLTAQGCERGRRGNSARGRQTRGWIGISLI
jgi:putative DNA primase/helicase